MDTPQPEFSVVPTPPRIQAPLPAPEPTPPIRRVVPPALLDELRTRFPGRTFVIPEDLSERERDELQFRDGGYLRGKMPRAPYIDLEDGGFYDGNLRKIRKPRFQNKD